MKTKKNSLRVLGVMTGTSCDSLDASCLEFSIQGWKVLWNTSAPYPASIRSRVLALQEQKTKRSLEEILRLNDDLGRWYGKTIKKLLAKKSEKPDVISNHGQTVFHSPPLSLQMGNPFHIAHETGLSVVHDLRAGDLSAGGEGAPLAPLFHLALASKFHESAVGTAIHNLGGISNLTYFAPKGAVFAFDTGPANLWMDECVRRATRGKIHYDKNGALASQGTVDAHSVEKILAHPYFSKKPPKSTGRDDFPWSYFQKNFSGSLGADAVATATAVTAESIANAYRDWIQNRKMPLKRVYFSGGGARNKTLLQWIQMELPGVEIATITDLDSNCQPEWIEAQAWALLGFYSLLGKKIGGTWTGLEKNLGPGGSLIPGENWKTLAPRLSSFLKNPPAYLRKR